MLDRKLIRDLFRSRGLLLTITSIIAVGITCFISLQTAYQNLKRAQTRYYQQCRMADFWIDVKKVPLTDAMQVGQLPGVVEVRPRIQFAATVDLEQSVKPINALVVSLPDRRRPVINDIVLRRGDYFSDERPNQVLVNDAFARAHRIHPGQRVYLLLNNRRQELLVVGTAISSEFTYLLGPGALVPDPVSFGVFYLKHSFAEEVFDLSAAANQIVGRMAPGSSGSVETILDRAERLLESFGVTATTSLAHQVSNQFLSSEIAGLGVTATILPAVFLIVAALVLNVLMTRLARQQRTVVGTLKALGHSDWQLFWHFVKFGLSVGLVGALLGSVLGTLSAAGMTAVYRRFFEFPALRSGIYWYTHAVGFAVSLLCAVAGSLQGARSVLRLAPAAAMRPEPPRRGGAVLLERLPGLWQRLSTPWRMALRNLLRNRVRSAVGVFASAMGSALLATGFMMLTTQQFLIEFQFSELSRSDMDVSLVDERSEAAWDEFRRLPAVDWAEPLLQVACTLRNGPYHRKTGVTGVLRDARLTTPRDKQGHVIRIPPTGLVLTRRLAEILHVQPGQPLVLVPVRGERRPVNVRVAAIADSYVGLAAFADIRHLSQLVHGGFAMNGAQLLTDRRPGPLRELYAELKRMPAVQSLSEREVMVRSLRETLVENQLVFISTLVAFAGTVFFGSLVNAALISLHERRLEVATLRATGYGEWRIGGVFLRETMVLNLAGSLAGLPLGYLLMVSVSAAYRENDLIRLPVITAPWVWITTLLLAVVFALLAHAVLQWRIFTLDVLEALKVRE